MKRAGWLMVLLIACGGAPVAAPASIASVAPAGPGRCLLLTTNDSEAHFDGARDAEGTWLGSIARVAAAKQAAIQERGTGNVLLLEGGDVLQGRYMTRQDGNRKQAAVAALQLYERAGYDYGVLGNHEFDAGPKILRAALEGLSRYRIVVSNLDAQGTALDPVTADPQRPLYTETAVVDCGGIRLGLFGLLTPSTKTISDFGDVRFPADAVHGPARAAVQKLRAGGAQVVVALTHLGIEHDVVLAQAVTGIDAIVGGHSHTKLSEPRRVGATWITQTGSHFSGLGRLDLVAADGGGLAGAGTTWQVQPLDAHPEEPTIKAAVDELRQSLLPEVVLGERKVAWDLRPGLGLYEYGRRAARGLLQHVQRLGRPVDAALLNIGGLRSATLYPPGPATSLDVAAIHPFPNRIVVVRLTGAQVKLLAEHTCGGSERGVGAGIAFACDNTRRPIDYTWRDHKPTAVAFPGERVQGLELGGKAVEPTRTYAVATLDYLARGGSGFFALTQGERTCLDGAPFAMPQGCPNSPLLADVIGAEVTLGTLDAPLP
jgi:2',3'-cyclic-nucleotide 2'-phosphodiesterase (5'-nucleotidase family)